MNIQKSIAVISGGASGLGEAVVRSLISGGSFVWIFDLQEEKGRDLQEELGENAHFLKVDITSEEEVRNAFALIQAIHNEVHILVNCAGIVAGSRLIGKPNDDFPVHDALLFQKVIQVNLIGTFNTMRFAASAMAKNEPNTQGERGVIINTASIAAFDGQVGQMAYAASKGGIVSMTLPAARDLAPSGIRVMAIAPGIFETPMMNNLTEETRLSLGKQVPFPSRLGKPSEFALLVLSILENPMLNGEVIRLDGAIRMAPK